jgi:drug/metabolite transporter (DMT)-like permease
MTNAALAYAAVAVTIFSWASSFPLIRLALQELAPIPLAAARFAVAAAMVLAWLAWRRPSLPSRSDAVRFGLCGLFGIALYNIFLNSGQQTVSAGAAAFIVNVAPIFTAILALAFLRERFNLWGWGGTLVSFSGIAIIASGQPGGLSFGAGSSFVFGAAVCTAIYFVIQKPLVAIYGALTCTALTLLAGAILLAPWLPQAMSALSAAQLKTIGAVIFLGIVPAAVGYATWTYALGQLGASRGSNFLYLIPPVATALAFIFTGEAPSVQTLIGGAVAITGVAIVNLHGRA